MGSEYWMFPEFAPQKALWLQWPTSNIGDEGVDERKFIPAFVKIVLGCHTEGDIHILIQDHGVIVDAKQKLVDSGVALDNLFFHIMPYDSVWIRDNGPIFVRKSGKEHVLNFGFNAWGYPPWGPFDKDNKVPERIAELLGIDWTQVEYIDFKDGKKIKDLIYEGGSFDFSVEGTIVGSWSICKQRNPNLSKDQATQIFKEVTGAHTVIWIDSTWPGTTGEKSSNHTDGYMKFYEKDKVCIKEGSVRSTSSIPVEGPGKEATSKLKEAGWDIRILPPEFRWSFVNCLIFNNKVIAGYVDNTMSPLEKEIMEELYPRKTIIPIEIGPMAQAGGGVHCVTQQQPR